MSKHMYAKLSRIVYLKFSGNNYAMSISNIKASMAPCRQHEEYE